jgi:hypothetical protein
VLQADSAGSALQQSQRALNGPRASAGASRFPPRARQTVSPWNMHTIRARLARSRQTHRYEAVRPGPLAGIPSDPGSLSTPSLSHAVVFPPDHHSPDALLGSGSGRSSGSARSRSRCSRASVGVRDLLFGRLQRLLGDDLARDGREQAIRLLDGYADIKAADVQALDVRWTPRLPIVAGRDNGNSY